MSWDPYWTKSGPQMQRVFHEDGTVIGIPSHEPFWFQDSECRYISREALAPHSSTGGNQQTSSIIIGLALDQLAVILNDRCRSPKGHLDDKTYSVKSPSRMNGLVSGWRLCTELIWPPLSGGASQSRAKAREVALLSRSTTGHLLWCPDERGLAGAWRYAASWLEIAASRLLACTCSIAS